MQFARFNICHYICGKCHVDNKFKRAYYNTSEGFSVLTQDGKNWDGTENRRFKKNANQEKKTRKKLVRKLEIWKIMRKKA
jgi:hypothetical protein